MRTTIRLDDSLLHEVKQLAAQRGTTMTAVIEDALRLLLTRREQAGAVPPLSLITVSGNGLQRGVDLDDSAALLDLMADHNVAA